ncbi:MAG: hypothetical protein PVF75_00865 [Granulosicoccaceae bacterium]|jgi:hypothetical protein
MRLFTTGLLGTLLTLGTGQLAVAGDVEIVKVQLKASGNSWRANVTLRHADTGWEHYADAWQVVDENGRLLGKRVLYHPHVNEQPFTRSLSNIDIPEGTNIVYIEAHDKVHGWSKQRVRVDLNTPSGERYQVSRQGEQ